MLYPFITDTVVDKIENGECLYWSIMMYTQSIKKQVVLPCCSATLEQDIVPLYHRYCSPQDWEWWVSILIDNNAYTVDQKTSCLTVFFWSTWARCCAPSALILFELRSRVVSVYIDRYWWICSRLGDKLSYRVVLQCLSQMLCPFITNIVPLQIESGECLYWSILVDI
jgi:hypothetical protein